MSTLNRGPLLLMALSVLAFAQPASGRTAAHHATHDAGRRHSAFARAACPFDTKGLDTTHLECGYLNVPENRHTRNSRTIQLAVTISKASGKRRSTSPVLVLEDPAGQSAPFGVIKSLHDVLPSHDVVVLDQRGSGFSKPSLCPWLGKTQNRIATLDLSEKEAARMNALALHACHDSLTAEGVDLAAYNVLEAAADVEALRHALGYKRWNLLAAGYGARVAQVVIREHPHSVRAIYMVPPEPLDYASVAETKIASIDRSLKVLSKRCRQDAACGRAHPDLAREFRETIAMLRKAPLHLPIDPALGFGKTYVINSQDFADLVQLFMGFDGGLAIVPMVVGMIHRRDLKTATPFFRAIMKSSRGDPHARNSQGVFYSDQCYDARGSHKRWEAVAAAHPAWASIADPSAPCDDWEQGQAAAGALTPVKSDIPVFAESGYLDPDVPPQAVDSALKPFAHVQHITFRAGSHSPSGPAAPCMLHLIKAFFANPQEQVDTSCVSKVPPLKFKIPGHH